MYYTTRNYSTHVPKEGSLPPPLLTFPQRHNVVGLLGGRTDAQLIHRQQAEAVDGEGRQAGHLI